MVGIIAINMYVTFELLAYKANNADTMVIVHPLIEKELEFILLIIP